jgi:NAD(P)-dependent dehydrogenase (short-subunit alcohol dehydrogenase family)
MVNSIDQTLGPNTLGAKNRICAATAHEEGEKMEFQNKVVFLTGSGGGIGLAIAQALIRQNASVAMIDVKPQPDNIPEGPGQFLYLECDLTNEEMVKAAVGATIEHFGAIHHLVNVAGVLWFDKDKSGLEIDLSVWDQVFDINLKSMVHTTRHIVPHMRDAGGGAMVHFSTIQCLRGDAAPQDAYQASNAGVVAYSKSLAIQLGSVGIRSNVILPGPVASPMQARWDLDPDAAKAVADVIPLGRLGRVEDMAEACLFLLSDRAAFISGTELIVDGGLMARP